MSAWTIGCTARTASPGADGLAPADGASRDGVAVDVTEDMRWPRCEPQGGSLLGPVGAAPTAIAVDLRGHLHLAFTSKDDELVYLSRSGEVDKQIVIDAKGSFGRVAVDDANRVHLLYADLAAQSSPRPLRYARIEHGAVTLAETAHPAVLPSYAIAVDRKQRVLVAYVARHPDQTLPAHTTQIALASRQGAVWQPVLVSEQQGPLVAGMSLVVDGAGRAHIGCLFGNERLVVYSGTATDHQHWWPSDVGSAGPVYQGQTLAVDAAGMLHAVRAWGGTLLYSTRRAGGLVDKWEQTVLSAGVHTAGVAVDSTNGVHVLFDVDDKLRRRQSQGGAWASATDVVHGAETGLMVADAANGLHIVYRTKAGIGYQRICP